MRQGRGGSRPSASSWKRREWGAPAGATLSFLSTAGSIAQLRRAAGAELPGNLLFVEAGLQAARAAAGGAKVSCVVGDAFVWPAAEAAAAAGAPWVPVWTAASCALLAHLRTDALWADVGDQGAFAESSLLFSCPVAFLFASGRFKKTSP